MIVTELQRAGDGRLVDTTNVFKWTSQEHSSAQDLIELHLKVNTKRMELPGSNEVVEQILASTWQPFDIHGEWDDKWGNRRVPSGPLTSTGQYAKSMFQAFAEMVGRSPFVRFELDALSFVGIITDFKPTYQRATKIGWAFTLSPHQNEAVKTIPIKDNSSQPIAKWVQDASDSASAIQDSFASMAGFQLKTPRFQLFSPSVEDLADSILRLTDILNQGFDTGVDSKLLLIATTFRRVRGSCLSIWNSLRTVTSANDVAFDDVILQMSQASWIAGTVTQSWQLHSLAKKAEIDVRKQARQKPKAIYYPKADESLERISLKFYGTADHWRAIYDKNNLSSLTLTGTEQLFIPEKNV
jgi:hypothetical protein